MSVRVLTIGLLVLTGSGSVFGQEAREKKQAERRKQNAAARAAQQKQTLTSKSGDPSRRVALDKSQQTAAIAFAKANHSELVPLLNSLRKTRAADYKRELRQLHAASTRLSKMKERVPKERYEQELNVWKLDSRIRLQLAKWAVSKDDKLAADIRKSLAERQAIRKSQYEQELARLHERKAKVESMLNGLTSERLDQEWERLSKQVTRRRKQPARKKADAKSAKAVKEKPKTKKKGGK